MLPQNYYFLFSLKIMYVDNKVPDDKKVVMAMDLNTMAVSDRSVIPLRLIGRTQEAAQANFLKQMNDGKMDVTVVNIIVNNIMRLGEFTQDEFYQGTNVAKELATAQKSA